MTTGYSFIDIVALDGVRERFAGGEALAVLNEALDEIVWANGAGARLFGHRDIEHAIGAEPGLTAGALRQITTSAGYHGARGGGQAIVRIGADALNLNVRRISLPGGKSGILIAAAGGSAIKDRETLARQAIAGFAEGGQFLALIDQEAETLAATAGFSYLGISRDRLADLIAEVRTERDRVVKRMVRGGVSQYPAGIVRLQDDPLLHLLVVVDEPKSQRESIREEGASPAKVDVEPTPTEGPVVVAPDGEARTPEVEQVDLFDEMETVALEQPPELESEPPAELIRDDQPPEPAGWARPPPEPEVTPEPPLRDAQNAPVRFLWRTDPDGRFNAISDEFLEAVGADAGSIVGQSFAEIADRFDLDPDDEIAGLLERRDTWSGRTVHWPLEDGLRVPVDLAALPAYNRDRAFEGFRGFGIVRFADIAPYEGRHRGGDAAEAAEVDDDEDEFEAIFREQQDLGPDDQADLTALDDGEADADPFRGEVKALLIVEPEKPPHDEKVVRLEEHRQTNGRGLSTVERSAFREIGNRLREEARSEEQPPEPFGKRKPEDRPAPGRLADIESEDEAAAREFAAYLDQTGTDEPTGQERLELNEVGEPEDKSWAEPDSDLRHPENAAEPWEDESPAATDGQESDHTLPVSNELEDNRAPSQPDDVARTNSTPYHQSELVEGRLLDRLPVPVLVHRGDALLYANAAFLELTEYATLEELIENGGLETLLSSPFDDQDENAEHHLHLRTKEGEEFPIDALLRSVPWNGGNALMLTVRRSGDEHEPDADDYSLNEARTHIAEMRAIIDTATDGVVLIDPEGNIRSISRPAEALFGFDSEELAGKPFTSLFAIESQRAARDYLAGLADHGVASLINDGRDVIGREAQGRFIPLFMTIGRLPNKGGYCAVLRDVTQWKRAEEELSKSRSLAEKASSQKTDFLARVSHEIRTPLNAIIGFSELMLDEKFGPVSNDRYRDYLRDINRSGNHVLDLVNDLLDISKIEAGEQEMAYESVSLNEALSEAVAIMQPQANRERVIIRSSFATRLPEVVADLRSIKQIALNILSNAVRFTQAGGQVIISTSYEPNGDIAMRVRDTGIGMSQAEIEQALKPFKQINALKRSRGDGTGLGLPLTKAMVEANRAKFLLTSAPGEGTLVEIVFPSTRVLAQ